MTRNKTWPLAERISYNYVCIRADSIKCTTCRKIVDKLHTFRSNKLKISARNVSYRVPEEHARVCTLGREEECNQAFFFSYL